MFRLIRVHFLSCVIISYSYCSASYAGYDDPLTYLQTEEFLSRENPENKFIREAVQNGNYAFVEERFYTNSCLDKPLNPEMPDIKKDTLLHFAVRNDDLDMAYLLLLRGASVSAKNRRGETPLRVAENHQNEKMMRMLGAYKKSKRQDTGDYPLHVAVRNGDTDWVIRLLHKGANDKMRNNSYETPYSMANELSELKTASKCHLSDKAKEILDIMEHKGSGKIPAMKKVIPLLNLQAASSSPSSPRSQRSPRSYLKILTPRSARPASARDKPRELRSQSFPPTSPKRSVHFQADAMEVDRDE